MKLFEKLYALAVKILSPFLDLIVRVLIGWLFVESGMGKFKHLDKTIEFFTSLNIPMPQLQAPFVAGVEFFGGALLILGLGTRIVSIPLAISMIVATFTARTEDIKGWGDLTGISEFLYVLIFALYFANGAGKISLDALLRKKSAKRSGGAV